MTRERFPNLSHAFDPGFAFIRFLAGVDNNIGVPQSLNEFSCAWFLMDDFPNQPLYWLQTLR
jgi:hypothetical protein